MFQLYGGFRKLEVPFWRPRIFGGCIVGHPITDYGSSSGELNKARFVKHARLLLHCYHNAAKCLFCGITSLLATPYTLLQA